LGGLVVWAFSAPEAWLHLRIWHSSKLPNHFQQSFCHPLVVEKGLIWLVLKKKSFSKKNILKKIHLKKNHFHTNFVSISNQ